MPVYFLDLEFGCRGKTHVRPIRQIAVYAEDGREVYAHEEPEPSTAGNARIAAALHAALAAPVHLVAHNGHSCDFKVLHYSLVRAGRALPPDTVYTCSYRMAEVLVDRAAMCRVVGNTRLSMENLLFFVCKRPLEGAHTARADALALLAVWRAWAADERFAAARAAGTKTARAFLALQTARVRMPRLYIRADGHPGRHIEYDSDESLCKSVLVYLNDIVKK